MRFGNILLVVDPSTNNEIACRRAFALARNEGAKLTVFKGVEPSKLDQSQRKMASRLSDQEKVVSTTRHLKDWVNTLNAADLDIDFQVSLGTPADEISALVKANQYDLVVKSIVDLSGFRSRARRRVDIALMRSCPCPLWLVNERDQVMDGVVLAALDFAPESMPLSRQNQRILDVARSVALAEFRPLHVVHAWQLKGESLLRSRSAPAAQSLIDEMVDQEEFQRTEWLNKLVFEAETESRRCATDFLDPRLSIVKGLANRVVPEQAKQLDARLVVMGSAARRGIYGFVTPNTSEQVLRQIRSSLLIVKPEDEGVPASRPGNVKSLDAARHVGGEPRRSSIRRRDRLSRQYTKEAI